MGNSFSYRQKKIGVIILLLLLAVLSYTKIIKHTYKQFLVYQRGTTNQTLFLEDSISMLNTKIKRLDAVLGKSSFEGVQLQQQLLAFLSQKEIEEYVSVTSIKPLHIFSDKEYEVITYSATIQGTYNEIMEVINQLEQNFSYSKIGSIKMYTKYDYKRKKKFLYAVLIFQNIKPFKK